VVRTPVGRIGCLIRWESYMPLARHALDAQIDRRPMPPAAFVDR
jgi:hypothetical protein